MTKMKARNMYHDSYKGENFKDEKSLTVPNQSYSIRELMIKFASGQHVPVAKPVYYDGETGDVTEEHIDPTLNPDYDLSDAFRDLEEIQQGIELKKIKQKDEKAQKEAEKPKKTDEAPGPQSPGEPDID